MPFGVLGVVEPDAAVSLHTVAGRRGGCHPCRACATASQITAAMVAVAAATARSPRVARW